ncbi:MAG: oligosaccharide flippase family protein [Bacteroidota bacterium]|nr:oligosaccharide flippase family protein [Bacteroidota bacterium]
MLNFKLKELFHHTLIKNISSLYVVQGLNFLFPLVTLPYLTRVLGVVEFGKVVLAQTAAIFCSSLIEYGFALSTTRKLALCRNQKVKLSDAVSNTISAKIFLSVITVVLFIALVKSHAFYTIENYSVEICLLSLLTGWNFSWFFRGVEKMFYLVALELFNKIFFTISIFIFVVHQNDGIRVLQLQSFFLFFITIVSFFITKRYVESLTVNLSKGWKEIAESWETFTFKGLATVHSNAPLIFISYVTSAHFVGIFAGAFKLSKQLMLAVGNPFWDALYPNLSYSVDAKTPFIRQYKLLKIIALNILFGILYGGVVFLFANDIVVFLLGKDFSESVSVLKILVLACPLIIASVSILNIFISQNLERVVNLATLLNIFIIILLLSLLTSWFGDAGSAWAIVVSECILMGELILFYAFMKE